MAFRVTLLRSPHSPVFRKRSSVRDCCFGFSPNRVRTSRRHRPLTRPAKKETIPFVGSVEGHAATKSEASGQTLQGVEGTLIKNCSRRSRKIQTNLHKSPGRASRNVNGRLTLASHLGVDLSSIRGRSSLPRLT